MFQQPYSSRPKYLHSYESIIILQQFPSRTNMKERNNQIKEKIQKTKDQIS
jgi:hypothetical protein